MVTDWAAEKDARKTLIFLSYRKEVVAHPKVGGMRLEWGAGSEFSLGLAKLEKQCPDSQLHGP